MSDDPDLYPGTATLKNKLGLRDAAALDRAERRLVALRIEEGKVPRGNFDLAHIQAMHRYLFQDIYAWAGDVRTVEMSKGESVFQFRAYIRTGMADVHRPLIEADFLRNLSVKEFADQAAAIIGDLNYVHPFREGNGRTQLQYLKQLAEQAGHPIDLTLLHPDRWLSASKAAFNNRYEPMARCIEVALKPRCARRRGRAKKKDLRC